MRAALSRADAFLHHWGPALLAVLAVLYYGQYYRSGLNLSGEGGTTALIAMRLMEGWLPFRDTFLGYNILWFQPVVWLFSITGPDYIALRIYFFALCLLAGLLAFVIVRRVTGLGAYACAVGAIVILIPGMLFRNYMGLLPLLCAWALLPAFVLRPRAPAWRWGWFAIAGAALGVTFLVRVELGNFMLVIIAGLLALYPLAERGAFWRRAGVAAAGGLVVALVALALQMPFYLDARKRGFAPEFVGQYVSFWSLLAHYAEKEFAHLAPPPAAKTEPKAAATPKRPLTPEQEALRQQRIAERRAARLAEQQQQAPAAAVASPTPATQKVAAAPAPEDLARPSLRDIGRQESLRDVVFVVILHLPILIAALIVLGAGLALLVAVVRFDSALKESALIALVTTGCALTLFPQYFFFRPDTPHLSEFMVPFVVAMACAAFLAVRATWRRPVLRWLGIAFATLCLVAEGLYFWHSWPKESAGTIAAARRRSHEMVGQNNVRVLLKRKEAEAMQGLHDAIVRHSTEADWVVVLPYGPTANFMTNRRTYMHNPYLDNATPGGIALLRQGVAQFEEFRPAIIVVDHRNINGTEYSRFRNWAAPVYAHIREHYRLVGTFDGNEVFVRPDRVGEASAQASP